ncbi:MAG: hypothetical protein ACI9MC_001289 [Kiritimatiellia bacterium]|jgi:hypothetical protein
MQDKDFIVKVRRLPGYESAVAIRFEMNEGFGEMLVGPNRKASPSTGSELPEARGDHVRAGRFVHVLASGRRRQSYALSRLDDDRLQRLPDSGWTELVPVTEFGIRYLDLPELGPVHSFAAVQVSAEPSPPRNPSAVPARRVYQAHASTAGQAPRLDTSGQAPRLDTSGQAPRLGTSGQALRAGTAGLPPRVSAPTPRSASMSPVVRANSHSAVPRLSADRAASGPALAGRTVTPQASRRVASPRPVPVRTLDSLGTPAVAPPVSLEAGLGEAAVRNLSAADARHRLLTEMNKVGQLLQQVAEIEAKLEQSRARERDLLDVLSRWQLRG